MAQRREPGTAGVRSERRADEQGSGRERAGGGSARTRTPPKGADPSGAVVINPVTVGEPIRMGSVTIGEPVTVGREVVVGHPADGRRPADPSPFFNAPFDPDAGTVEPAERRPDGRRRARRAPPLVFVPWYPIGSRLMAGLPVPHEAADAAPGSFDEGGHGGQGAVSPGAADDPADRVTDGAIADRSRPGGLTLELSPPNAGVYLDDSFVGHASDFLPSRGVLELPPGLHTIELRAEGYEPARFDILATSGQVIPLAGSLNAQR
jgi:hypothetical protein